MTNFRLTKSENYFLMIWLIAVVCLTGGQPFEASPATAEEIVAANAEQTSGEKKSSAEEEKATSTAKAKKPKKVRLAHIAIKGKLPESPGQMTLFGDLGIDLRKTIARLDKAAKDEKIAAVILEIRPAALSRGKLNELRAAVSRVQAAGKKVYAQTEAAIGGQFLLATACDEIVMPEAGMVFIPGVRAELAYYKELLEKIGIEADMMHVGAYKGAAEPLTRSNMSEPVKKNMTALVDDLYDQILTTVAADRQLQIDEVRASIDQGLLSATQAKEAGLIDRVSYPDAFRAHLSQQFDTENLVYVMNYGKKKHDTDFSGPMGMIKLFQAIIGAATGDGGAKGPKIAVVYAVGPITSGKSDSGAFGGNSMGSDTIVEALRKAADQENVKAIVLRINSPGGSALASDMIWRATQAIDKPIIASMGDVAASGGYYIAMGADRIVAEPGTITGSIGVVGGKLNMGGLFGKIGITTDVISRGKNSGMFSSTTNFSESERQVVSDWMHDIYRIFTTKAAAGRNMPLEKLESLAGGQVYTGRVAKRNGLVDELGTLKDAIQAAKQLAGIDAEKKVGLEIFPEPENPFEKLLGADLDAEREVKLLGSLGQIVPELSAPMRRALQLRKIFREPVALMMPYWVEIK